MHGPWGCKPFPLSPSPTLCLLLLLTRTVHAQSSDTIPSGKIAYGVAFAGALVLVLILVWIYILLRRRRKRKRLSKAPAAEASVSEASTDIPLDVPPARPRRRRSPPPDNGEAPHRQSSFMRSVFGPVVGLDPGLPGQAEEGDLSWYTYYVQRTDSAGSDGAQRRPGSGGETPQRVPTPEPLRPVSPPASPKAETKDKPQEEGKVDTKGTGKATEKEAHEEVAGGEKLPSTITEVTEPSSLAAQSSPTESELPVTPAAKPSEDDTTPQPPKQDAKK